MVNIGSKQKCVRSAARLVALTRMVDRLRSDPLLSKLDFDRIVAEGYPVGRAPQQVDEFLAEEVGPIRRHYRPTGGPGRDISV